jgi:hypothetical protein
MSLIALEITNFSNQMPSLFQIHKNPHTRTLTPLNRSVPGSLSGPPREAEAQANAFNQAPGGSMIGETELAFILICSKS